MTARQHARRTLKTRTRKLLWTHPMGLLAFLGFTIIAYFARNHGVEFFLGALMLYLLLEVWDVEDEAAQNK